MDAMSLRIISFKPLIERTVRNMAHRYNTLSRSEVEAQCWESMWRVLQKKDGGNPRDVEGLYYFQCRSDLKGLVKWYSHRNKYVVATETQPDVVTDDDPLHYLIAQDALEAATRPLGGLLQEVMTGLGVKEAWAKQKVRKAKAALGVEKALEVPTTWLVIPLRHPNFGHSKSATKERRQIIRLAVERMSQKFPESSRNPEHCGPP